MCFVHKLLFLSIRQMMLDALGKPPSAVGTLDNDLLTVSETKFDPEVVKAAAWKPGMAVIWDNAQWLHSTTPTVLYTSGRRVMYQIIMGK